MFEAPRPTPQATRRPSQAAASVETRGAERGHPPSGPGQTSRTATGHAPTSPNAEPSQRATGAAAANPTAPEHIQNRASSLPHYLQIAAARTTATTTPPAADHGSTGPAPASTTAAAAGHAAPAPRQTPMPVPLANGPLGEAAAAPAVHSPRDGARTDPAAPPTGADGEAAAKEQVKTDIQSQATDGKARQNGSAPSTPSRLKGEAAERATHAQPPAANATPATAPKATPAAAPTPSAAGAVPTGGAAGGATGGVPGGAGATEAAGDTGSPGGGEAATDTAATSAGTDGGAAEAVQEQTEEKMAAAHPEGAAEEAQAEHAAATDSDPGEADTTTAPPTDAPADTGEAGASDHAGGAAATGAARADSDNPAESASTAATTNTPSQTDPDAAQRAQTASEAREHSQDSQRVAEAASEAHADDQAEQQADASAGGSAPAGAELSSAETGAGLADLGENVGGGGDGGGAGAAGGGGGGGAAAPATEEATPPDLAAQDPADGLGAAASLGPVQAGAALGGVGSAIERTAGEEGQALQDQMPSPEVGEDGAPASAVQALPGEAQAARPQAVQPGASPATPQPAPTPPAGPAPVASVAEPQVSAGEDGKVSSEDGARVQGAVDALPTHDPGLDVPVGAPPQVQLSGEADPASADRQKAELDQTVATQRQQGAADAAAPAGENAIRSTRPREVLKPPEIAKGGAAGGGQGAADAGAAAEGLAIIANEKKGPEVRAAMAQAQAQMAGKKGEHQQKVSTEKRQNDEQMAALRAENAAEQAAEKAGARGEVAKARSDWTAEQRKAIDTTGQKAGQELAKGHTKVQQEQRQADDKATQHIGDGEREASEAKASAERDASAKKAEAKKESGGVFGWLSSKVSSFFSALKRGITAIFDAAKKLVRAAIDKAKKLAVAVIEAARKAIVSIIKAVGAALIALGDVLLAAFPNLKRRFRSFIEAKVKAAENAVNRLADALKKGVTKLLDALGKAFEFLLDAYKKAMFMVLDAAKAVVDGAIKAAKAVADLVGTFIVLIKDIAANPGGWIANLGAAVMDGVKNHLWKAFKTAVKGWFDDKLEQVLGVGTAIWSVLKKGGIAIKDVGKMAFEALKAAIPQALIQLLIEKVAAMIVPAAGAVMAIIEGLQAAWGTVQRIIAALGKFVSFLKAVKAGGAGPQFADLLASAAIVVIDFVANWLLKKLRGPASKVSAKVKAIAQKIMAKVKAALKKVGGALKKVAKKIGGAFRKGKKKLGDWRDKRRARKDAKNTGKKNTKEDKQARFNKAVNAIKPQLQSLASGGAFSRLWLKGKLLFWRVRHRLTSLSLTGSGDTLQVQAKLNPEANLVQFIKKNAEHFRTLIREAILAALKARTRGKGDASSAKIEKSGAGTTEDPHKVSGKGSAVALAQHRGQDDKNSANYQLGGGQAGVTRQGRSGSGSPEQPAMQRVVGAGKTRTEAELREDVQRMRDLTNKGESDIAKMHLGMLRGEALPKDLSAEGKNAMAAQFLHLSGVEPDRSPAALLYHPEGLDDIAHRKQPWDKAMGPSSQTLLGAGGAKSNIEFDRTVEADLMEGREKRASPPSVAQREAAENAEVERIARIIEKYLNAEQLMAQDEGKIKTAMSKKLKTLVPQLIEAHHFGGPLPKVNPP